MAFDNSTHQNGPAYDIQLYLLAANEPPALLFQVTAVRFWKECDQDQDSTPGKSRSPRGTSPNIASTVSQEEDGRGGKENAGRGGMMTMVSDGRPYRQRNTGNSGQHRARRGGSLTCPSKADGGSPSCVSGDTTSVHHPPNEEEGSVVTRVVTRSPSPASSLASGVGLTAATGRLWGDNATEGTLPSEQQGGDGKGLGLKARAGKKKRNKLGTWGQRKPRRDAELTDWLETNTNLVNVSPW